MAAAHPVAVFVGTAAALLSITSFAPQIVKIWKEKDASSVSLRTYVVTVTGFGCWLTYGLMIKAWPVAASNLACLVMSAAVLALKWRYGRGRSGNDVKG
ncbi:SemiSWEET family sugar transporter [Caulobacter endophyticus]|uniref:SemiSWEET family sugar transporter n=1 Tax=Caulobacter endophyticus TaxID=2172652 RepID=UPI00240FBEC2|nr:SemiSWEET transporter [Caulobacter endophyticus]MDG2528289.1 SemiSWEET transporter [Caulobacter endophyticus]